MALEMTRRSFMKGTLMAGISAALARTATAAPQRASYDVVVVGAGVVGCCAARELARWDVSVLVLEAGLDIAGGATRANSGIVHVGFDPQPGTLKARFNVEGAALFGQWQAELGFSYSVNGALVLAFDDTDLQTLEELKLRGEQNGAAATRIIGQEELRALEPNVSPEAVGALYAPTSGIVDPYGLAFAAAENAAANGVEFSFGRRVVGVEAAQGGGFVLTAQDGTAVEARAVLNAAGVFSDEVNNMACAEKLAIAPRRGEYQLYHNKLQPFTHTLFQTPTDKGKGVLITHAAFGNLIVGPNSVAQESKTSVATTAEGLDEIVAAAAKTWPDVPNDDVISNFCGLRAKNADTGDFVIGQSDSTPGFFNAACIDSPGLASAPAIAVELARQISAYLDGSENASFDPRREALPPFAFLDEATQQGLLAQDSAYGTVVCRDCGVREAEIVSVLHGPLGVHCLDAVKWRTGAMMGPCQGGRCLSKICALIMRELGISPEELCKRDEGSAVAVGTLGEAGEGEASGETADVAGGAGRAANPGGAAEAGRPGDAGRAAGLDAVLVEAASQVAFDEDVIEMPRASYRIPGTRPAGVYAARAAIELLAQGVLVGKQAVVWGSTDLAQTCATLLERAGTGVVRLPDDARIARIDGDARLERVVVERDGATQDLACDTLVVSHDLGAAEN